MSRHLVVDTDVLSFIYKGDTRGTPHVDTARDARVLVSFQTVAELLRWGVEQRWGEARRRRLESFLESLTVIHSNAELCLVWAQVMASARARGRPTLAADAWVAATAIYLEVPLLTHNVRDFSGVEGLQLLTAP